LTVRMARQGSGRRRGDDDRCSQRFAAVGFVLAVTAVPEAAPGQSVGAVAVRCPAGQHELTPSAAKG
jgi:hypothetical protein